MILSQVHIMYFFPQTQIQVRKNKMFDHLQNLKLSMCECDTIIKSLLLQSQKLRTLTIHMPMKVNLSDWDVKVLSLQSFNLIADDVKDFYPFFKCNPNLQNVNITTAQMGKDEIRKNVFADNIEIKRCCIGFQKLINQ